MIPEEVKQYIGKLDPPHVREVEKGAIRRYAQAVGDGNPLYSDEEYAKKSRYGSVIAPPGFFGWAKGGVAEAEAIMKVMGAIFNAGFYRILDGGMSYDFYLPVCAGDTLVCSPKVGDIYERESKSGGKMVFAIFETSYLNQNGDLVAKAYQTLIAR